jgi:hypothetical protein
MKKTLFTLFIFFITFGAFAQETIKEAKISMSLPNEKWTLNQKADQNGTQAYIYKREPVIDSLGRRIIPNLAIIVEDIESNLDVVTYSALKRSKTPFKVSKVFIQGDGPIEFKNAIGYLGSYTDNIGDHTIYMIYLINNKKGVQVICDVVTSLFDKLDPEFQASLQSIKKAK